MREGFDTPAGKWVVVGGAVAATGGIACVAGGCEALAGAAGAGAITAEVAVESDIEAATTTTEGVATDVCELTANSSINSDLLSKQLASDSLLSGAQSGIGRVVAGQGSRRAIDDIQRLIDTYGGSPTDWLKMSTRQLTLADGTRIEVHWYQNNALDKLVEFKTKLMGR